jgi:hypothetical protein
LRDLVPLSSGYVLFFTSPETNRPAAIRMLRVSDDLAALERRTLEGIGRLGLDATSIGNAVYLGYARAVVEPRFEGVSRAFVRYAPFGPRRRVVR